MFDDQTYNVVESNGKYTLSSNPQTITFRLAAGKNRVNKEGSGLYSDPPYVLSNFVPGDVKLLGVAVPLALDGISGSENFAHWKLYVNGEMITCHLIYDDGVITIQPVGITLIFR